MKVMRKVLSALLFALLLCGAAWGDIVYTTSAADYSSGTVGAIIGSAGARTVEKDVVGNLKSDLLLFSFTNGGAQRVLLDERDYTAANDKIYVYGPESWTPIANRDWSMTKNAHAFAVHDERLYAGAYDNASVVAYSMNESGTAPYGPTGHYYNCPADAANYQPHTERIVVEDSAVENEVYVFALVNHADASSLPNYMDSEIIRLDRDLGSPTRFGLVGVQNASDMVLLNDTSLIVAYRGGAQRAGTKGGIIRIALDAEDEITEIAGGESGVDIGAVESICSDGAGGLWIVAQEYKWSGDGNDTYVEPETTLYRWDGSSVTKESDISGSSGSAYSVRRDEADGTVAVVAGDKLLVRNASGSWKMFDSAQLGGNPTSVAFIKASNNNPDDNENGGGSGGGGGCSAMGFGALALVLPLCLIRRKSR